MNNDDYLTFRDTLIVAIADAQSGDRRTVSAIKELCEQHGLNAAPTWIDTISKDMERQGWGQDFSTYQAAAFLINGTGLVRAAEVRKIRKPTVSDRLASEKFQKISNLGISVISLTVSIIALVFACLAYFKGN